MFTFLLVFIAFTYGYIAAVQHANYLDQREEKRRAATVAPWREDHSHVEAATILNYDN